MMFELSKEGYVLNYLTTDAVTYDFKAPYTDKDQLKFESEMRKLYCKPCTEKPTSGKLGEISSLGTAWKFYAANRNTYIDFSAFYFTLQDVKIHAITQLVSEKAQKIKTRIWSYARVNIWLNNILTACIDEPVYKPISYVDFEMDLKAGVNDIFIAMENLGVRDTRNIFSLQLKSGAGISVTLPTDRETLVKLKEAEDWLCSVESDGVNIWADFKPPVEVCVTRDGKHTLWKENSSISANNAMQVKLSFEVCGQQFFRLLDLMQNRNIDFAQRKSTVEERIQEAMQYISELRLSNHYSAQLVLARYSLNKILDELDYQNMDHVLKKVKSRVDCADFGLLTLLTIYQRLPITEEYKQKIKEAALDFRYWMDEEGADGMCFWSENHALIFFTCQMLAGKIWPEEYFTRSKRQGREQYQVGYERVSQWFDLVEHDGFEEFLSGGYLLVTMATLLVVHMFGDEELKSRAVKVMDRIIEEACLQCFDGIHLAPMGRVYRTALVPYQSGLQALLYILDGRCAKTFDIWLGLFALADYKLPENAAEMIDKAVEVTFDTGRASVTTKKTKGYMLTSVACPRKMPLKVFPHKDSLYYKTFEMNEWFHGTSLFVPGDYGYQQHLWYAAISNKCYTFVNHPGTEKDFGKMRPDYWYGNGVFPALSQEDSTLYCYYEIPDSHPTKFTHMYWPSFAMEQEISEEHFRFARVGTSYMAIWCSQKPVLHNGDGVMNVDYRAYGNRTAWVVRVGTEDEFGSFEDFMRDFKALNLNISKVKAKWKAL